MSNIILSSTNLSVAFNGFYAVRNVNLSVREGATHAIIGPNGAGKTTLFNLLTKFVTPTTGVIRFHGKNITASKPHTVARLGIIRSFQISAVFNALTVQQNLALSLLRHYGLAARFYGNAFSDSRLSKRIEELALAFHLERLLPAIVANLPYGSKRALELAMTLAPDPKVILLDEPMAGLATDEIETITTLIAAAAKNRTTLIVEHNMKTIQRLCDTVTVMQAGKVLAEGTYSEVSAREDVIAAYIGGD